MVCILEFVVDIELQWYRYFIFKKSLRILIWYITGIKRVFNLEIWKYPPAMQYITCISWKIGYTTVLPLWTCALLSHLCRKICNIIFRKRGGGVKGHLELFRNNIRFGISICPLSGDASVCLGRFYAFLFPSIDLLILLLRHFLGPWGPLRIPVL